jgi:hypothetical protein
MQKPEKESPWVWVFVQDPGGNEQFLGQHYPEDDISFIPAFHEKEDALLCLNSLKRDLSLKYEPQAIRLNHLTGSAAANGFMVFILDGSGRILEKITP